MNNLLVRSGQLCYDAAEENKSNYVLYSRNEQTAVQIFAKEHLIWQAMDGVLLQVKRMS